MIEKLLARIDSADVVIEDRGGLCLSMSFAYDKGSVQGLCLALRDTSAQGILAGVLAAVGVSSVSALKGQACWIHADYSHIYKIEPLFQGNGIPFLISPMGGK